MSYNFKVFELGNGEIQLCIYPNSVQSLRENENNYDENVKKLLNDIKERGESPSLSSSSYSLLSDEEKYKINFNRSIIRSKDSLYKLALCNKWDYFVTFTFDNENFRYDYDICIKRFRKWLNHFKERYCPSLLYIFIVECHKDGAYHLHGLFQDPDDMVQNHIDHATKTRDYITKYHFGRSDISKVIDPARVSNYISKYVTKELVSRAGKHRYFCSSGLKHPGVKTFDEKSLDVLEFLDNYYPGFQIRHIYSGRNETSFISLKKMVSP